MLFSHKPNMPLFATNREYCKTTADYTFIRCLEQNKAKKFFTKHCWALADEEYDRCEKELSNSYR